MYPKNIPLFREKPELMKTLIPSLHQFRKNKMEALISSQNNSSHFTPAHPAENRDNSKQALWDQTGPDEPVISSSIGVTYTSCSVPLLPLDNTAEKV